jgi:nitroreductase
VVREAIDCSEHHMTTFTATARTTALRRAAVRATYAPSVHNTQPWRMHIVSDELRIYADRDRQLPVLDPTGRQLAISVGCAVFNARAALAGRGYKIAVERFPDRADPDLAAALRIVGESAAEIGLAALDEVVEVRQTNRRRFTEAPVPESLLDVLEEAAAAEEGRLVVVRDPDKRVAVASLSQHADNIENLNPAYRAELRAWTSDDPERRDGVPALAVPHVTGRSEDEVPIRDFDTHGAGGLPAATHSSRDQCLVLLCTVGDGQRDWLRAGEALERVLLEITRHGFMASPLTQVTEVPAARAELRRQLALDVYPHVLLRVGRAPLTPRSRRRRLAEVLFEQS